MNRLKFFALAAMAFALFITTQAAANVLTNPGFEDDAIQDAEPTAFVNGWTPFQGADTASASLHPTRTGIGSLRMPGRGGYPVPGAFQTFPANPGEIWDLQGYFYTPEPVAANDNNGLLKIVWGDGTQDLQPAEVMIGTGATGQYPGVESLPRLDETTTPGVWHFSQARGVAPAGTTQVSFYALLVDQTALTIYFDDLVATMITDTPLLGDYNNNKTVDAADYTIWRNNFGANFALQNRDPANTGAVSNADYTVWKNNFGMTKPGSGSVGGTSVPEPATLVMTMLVLAGCGMLRRKK